MDDTEYTKLRNIDVWINGVFIGTYGSMKMFHEVREKTRRDADLKKELELVGNLVVGFFDNIANEGTPEAGEGGSMTKQEPPNLRGADTCTSCKRGLKTFDGTGWCKKYKCNITWEQICDDFEREGDE